MDEFRKGATRVLITTDVWARGLDVQQVRNLWSVVIDGEWPMWAVVCLHVAASTRTHVFTHVCFSIPLSPGVAGHQLRLKRHRSKGIARPELTRSLASDSCCPGVAGHQLRPAQLP